MSRTAAHASRLERRICQRCRDRKARFRYRGVVKADRDHTLCFECYRSERERRRARALADAASPNPLHPLFRRLPVLSTAELEHRRRMLAHLTSQARRGA